MANDGRMPHPLLMIYPYFLTLMADQNFKSCVAMAYAQEITGYSSGYSRGFGSQDRSIYNISVQFLNRKPIVDAMQMQHKFLNKIGISLSGMLHSALSQLIENVDTATLCISGCSQYYLEDLEDVEHKSIILQQRRYNPLVGDLRVICSLEGIPYRFTQVSLKYWLYILGIFHKFHPQIRAINAHIEREGKIWMQAFNLCLALASLFDPLLAWISCRDYNDLLEQNNFLLIENISGSC